MASIERCVAGRRRNPHYFGIEDFALSIKTKLRYDAGSGTGLTPIQPQPYRRPLRVQTIKAEIRPTKASRITNIRIISRSSFPLQVKARPAAGLSHLKLRLPRARTCPVTFHGKLMNSAAAGESSLFILDANAVARNHGLMAKTVPYPADPPTEVVPKSTVV